MVSLQNTKLFSVYGRAGDLPSGTETIISSSGSSLAQKPSVPSMPETFVRKLTLPDKEVILNFLVVRLDQSCFCWCGTSTGASPRLESLVVAMTGGKTGPVATTVLGAQLATADDEAGAIRIARKAKLAMIHLSTSFGAENSLEVRMFAEKCLVEALTRSS